MEEMEEMEEMEVVQMEVNDEDQTCWKRWTVNDGRWR